MSRHGTSRTGRYRTRCRTARTPSAATQSPTFSKTEYPFLGNNHVVADFNGDGRVDLAGVGGNSAAVRLNTGAGAFGARVDYPVGGPAQDLAAGDFNADGRLDLAVTINDPQIGFSLLTGNGDGTFAAPVNFANTSGFDSPAVVAVDLNNDAKLDVVAAHQIACYTAPCVAALTISVLMGNGGDGTFQPRVLYLPPPPSSVGGGVIVAANLDGDAKPDLAFGRTGAFPAFLVLLNSTAAAPPATPAAPTLLSPAQDATPAQPVTFDWTDVAAATSYRIQIDDSSTFSAPRVVDQTVTASQFTAPTLAARQHWWRVRGINSAGTAGAWSTVPIYAAEHGAGARCALGALRDSDERDGRHRVAGAHHAGVGRAGGRPHSLALEQQHGRDGAVDVVGRAGRDQRDLRDLDERGHHPAAVTANVQ